MAVRHGYGKIVTDGLVLALDAADRNSYTSGSTTWNDVSGNGNDVSLTTGPVFDTSSKSIVFDGIDDYLTLSNIDTYSSNAQFTIEMIVKSIGGNWGRIFTNGSNGSPGSVTGFINVDILMLSSGNKPNLYLRVGNSLIFNTQISTSTWGAEPVLMYMGVSVDKQSNEGRYYIKFGEENSGLIQTELSSTFTPGNATAFVENRLGGETDNESYAEMNLSVFKIYNRELSINEMRQNYNHYKTRFGL